MHGSKTPVVLRRDGNERLRYRVVGQCYWEGVMYGEAVDWELDEAGEFVLI